MTGSRAPGAVRHALTFWRRSIQARVVASTVILSALVFGVVGWFLMQQTRDGLLENRVRTVVAEANQETGEAQSRLAAASGTTVDPSDQRNDLVDPMFEQAKTRGFGVIFAGPGSDVDHGGTNPSEDVRVSSVPERLEQALESGRETAWTYSTIRYDRDSGPDAVPGIVVGSRIQLPSDGQMYTIYYLFPLEQELQTLALVERALLTAGVLLLVLMAGVTWLVTQQVVSPIRLARRVAERLAAGHLEERMRVSGEDDLARLAVSFNQMASNLQRQIRQLEELSRVQRRFASDVSHELRTPLTTVRMASDVLHDARTTFDPVTARAAELMESELGRFESLLGDLLEISRFDAGAAVLDVDDVDLVDVAQRVVDATRHLAERRGSRVIVEAPPGPCIAEADVRRVERIVRNLVSNAIDHAETGDVVIRLASDDEAAALAVRDYGVGLAAGESAMVFNRFWRRDPARDRSTGGTGLGLSISLEDTHLHGGWLQAWGQPGQGAQFRLTLPRRVGGPLRKSPLPLVPTDLSTGPTVGADPAAGAAPSRNGLPAVVLSKLPRGPR